MPPLPTLDTLTVAPSIVVEVEGRSYRFTELSLAALGRLQATIKRLRPHPLEAVKPLLDGLPAEAQAGLIDRAVSEARDWPPRIGTAEGSAALLGSREGLAATLHEGLAPAHPEATPEDAGRILSALDREVAARKRAGLPTEPKVGRIFAVLFGSDPDAVQAPGPKA